MLLFVDFLVTWVTIPESPSSATCIESATSHLPHSRWECIGSPKKCRPEAKWKHVETTKTRWVRHSRHFNFGSGHENWTTRFWQTLGMNSKVQLTCPVWSTSLGLLRDENVQSFWCKAHAQIVCHRSNHWNHTTRLPVGLCCNGRRHKHLKSLFWPFYDTQMTTFSTCQLRCVFVWQIPL